MGGRVQLTLYAEEVVQAERAARAAFARFAELEQVFSDYRPGSEAMRLVTHACPGVASPVGRDLFRVLERAQEVAKRSDGAFDVTCGPLVRLWREARRTRVLPSPTALAEARARTGWTQLRLIPGAERVALAITGMTLDFGGIAKGFACDEALQELRRHGVSRALVEAGGDVAASGAPPGTRGWRVAVRGIPGRTFWLVNAAMSTSGDAEQYVEIDGVRYSHILDPRTGLGTTHRRQVTVIARQGLTTDPLATALCVLDPEDGRLLAQRYGARAIFVD